MSLYINSFFYYTIVVTILAFVLLLVNFLLSPHILYEAKVSPYECGFIGEIFQTREIFSIQFILVALLFLPFDMELVLFFPIVPVISYLYMYGFISVLSFFFILTLGFILEIGSGAISLTNNKNILNNNDKNN